MATSIKKTTSKSFAKAGKLGTGNARGNSRVTKLSSGRGNLPRNIGGRRNPLEDAAGGGNTGGVRGSSSKDVPVKGIQNTTVPAKTGVRIPSPRNTYRSR